MDGLSSDDDEVQFTGALDADAARERDRAAAEASGNAFDLCTQESTAAAEPDTDGEDASPFVGGGDEAAPPAEPRRRGR